MIYRACHTHDEYVSISDEAYDEAFRRGEVIYNSSQSRKFKDYVTCEGCRKQSLGEVCACAVAKLLCLEYINSLDSFKGPDLPYNIEVRLIGVDHYGLRVRPTDTDSKRVVGVVIERGKERQPYRIPGWINAEYGKKYPLLDPGNRKRPFHGVPQDRLFSLNALRSLIAEER